MKTCVYQLVCALCVLMSCLPHTSADFSTERAKVTKICSITLDKCVYLSGSLVPSTDAGWCSLLGAAQDGVTFYQCVVRIGFCTDEEFVALNNEACEQTATVQQMSSALKTAVYTVIESTSYTCHGRILDSIFLSGVATVLKQQEQYCKLMKFGVMEWFSGYCTKDDITSLNSIACTTTQHQPFSDAIVATSLKCQDGMDICMSGATQALALIRGEKYCDGIRFSGQFTAHDCLIATGCTESEFSNVKTTACSISVPHTSADFGTERAKVTKICSITLDKCVYQSGSLVPSTDAGWCSLLGAAQDGVTFYQCVVRIGFCTDEEFVALNNEACGQTATVQQKSSALKTAVYTVIESTSNTCHGRTLDVIFLSSVATVLKQQEQYCKLMKFGVMEWFSGYCTKDEITSLNSIACTTTQHQPFSDAIVTTSLKCQDGMDLCFYFATQALTLIRGGMYCDGITFSGQSTVHDCMIATACTESEFSNVKNAACSISVPHTSADFSTERAKVTKICSITLDKCVYLSGSLVPSTDAGWCSLLGAEQDGVTFYQCVVRIGFCTDEEFVALNNEACGQTATVQQKSSALKTAVYTVIESTSYTCHDVLLDSIFLSSEATVLKQQEQYCKLMKFGDTVAFSGSCTKSEITSLNSIACTTTEHQSFSDAIVTTSTDCQDAVVFCTSSTSLNLRETYCDVVTTTTHDCLVKEGCTESEASKLKTAACIGSHVQASVILLALVVLHQLF